MMPFFVVGLSGHRHQGIRIGLFVVLAMVFGMVVAACSSDDDPVESVLADIDRSPDTSIIIPAGQPLVIGVSSALTGPAAPRGQEYRDAVVVAVEQWKRQNGPMIAGHEISIVSEDDGCTEADVTRKSTNLRPMSVFQQMGFGAWPSG